MSWGSPGVSWGGSGGRFRGTCGALGGFRGVKREKTTLTLPPKRKPYFTRPQGLQNQPAERQNLTSHHTTPHTKPTHQTNTTQQQPSTPTQPIKTPHQHNTTPIQQHTNTPNQHDTPIQHNTNTNTTSHQHTYTPNQHNTSKDVVGHFVRIILILCRVWPLWRAPEGLSKPRGPS